MDNLPDNNCIDRVLTGDTEAFSELVGRYSPRVFALCMRIVQEREEAQDAVQETFIRVFDNLSRLRFRFESSFATWLYRIAFNTAVSHARGRRRSQARLAAGLPDDRAAYGDDGVEDRLARLEKAVGSLGAEDRGLIQLFYYDDRPVAEIAEIMSLSAGNVKTRLHRIRRKLGESLSPRSGTAGTDG